MGRPIKNIERKGGLEKAMSLVFAEDYEGLKAAFPQDPVIEVMTSCVRSAFVAAPGKRLDVSDLSAIENRVLGWVADEQAILDVFREDKDPYLDFASFWFNIPYATLEAQYKAGDPDAIFNRQISKPAVLGCGYRQAGGGWGKNKAGDRVKTGLWKYAEDMFCPMTQDQAHEAVHIFRTRYKKVVNLWYDVERAVARCIKTGTTEWLGPTKKVWCDRRKRKNGEYVLRIHLPSGRCLHYLNAHMEMREMPGKDGQTYEKETIIYEGIDQVLKIWTEITTHGGKLVENIVQAIARDILVHGMLLADEIGLFIVAHVHDEIVCENPDTEDGLGLEDLVWCMSQVEDCYPGLPLAAKGWSGYFYKK
jgi:DNA polymerase